MNTMIKIGSRLAIICAVAAIVLALVNGVTAPKIALYRQQVLEQGLASVSEGYELGDRRESDLEGIDFFYDLLKEGSVSGYVLQIEAAGYGGPMTMLAGYTTAGEVIGVELLDNAETPGLGTKAEEDGYMDKFIGTGAETDIPVRKSDLASADADAVSGSTITFSAIANALVNGSQFAEEQGADTL
jgi:electron transport complex protein RnfG